MKDCIVHISNDGKIINTKAVKNLFDSLKSGKHLLTCKNINNRSLDQNKYYWSCIVPLVRKGLFDAGYNDVTENETAHEILKHLFLKKKVSNGIETIEIAGSSADLTTIEFSSYIEQIAQWASEYLGIVIPPPGTQTSFFNE